MTTYYRNITVFTKDLSSASETKQKINKYANKILIKYSKINPYLQVIIFKIHN